MSDRPLVSCVIPTYDRPNRLERAINCVLHQTYRPLELIVVDDSSPSDYAHNSAEKIEDSDIDVRVIQHDQNQGASAARNTGVKRSNGDYIAFLDDDDKWLPEKIKKQISNLEQSDADLSYCWVRRVGPEGEHRATHTPEKVGYVTRQLFTGNFTGTTSTIVVSKKSFREIDGFDTSLPRWNDWDFALRASLQTKFDVVPEILVHQYNWEGEQLSDDLEKLKTAQQRFRTKHGNLAKEHNIYNIFESRMHFGLGYSAGMSGEFDIARQSLVKAIKSFPYSIEFYIYLIVFSGGYFTLRPAQIVRRIISRLTSDL